MLIGIPLETTAGETRVAVTPETAKKLKAQGHVLRLQSNAGRMASAPDAELRRTIAEVEPPTPSARLSALGETASKLAR